MPDDTTDPTSTPDPLRLDRCPDCGYLLTGLPEQGICPECAFAYSPEMIVLYGWGRGQRANITNARGWRVIVFGLLGCVWALSMLLPGTVMFVLFRDWRIMLLVLGLFVAFTWALLRRWRRNRQDSPAPVQVRLCRQGFAQRNGIGPVRLRQWRTNNRLRLRPSGSQLYRIVENVSFWSWSFKLVDMEFACDPAAAQRITSRINTWREGLSAVRSAER
jgi:hypothetical protein